MNRYRVTHTTHYAYTLSVALCHNEAHLLPRPLDGQHVRSSQLVIDPAPAVCAERSDFFGNRVTYFAVQEPHAELTVTAVSLVDVRCGSPPDAANAPAWESVCEQLKSDLSPDVLDARPYTLDSPFISARAELAAFARDCFPERCTVLAGAFELMRRIHADFTFDPNFTTVATPLSAVLEHRRGVCQDFAHLAIGCLRSLGLAARYVSGYFETIPPAGQARLVGADASHAWCSVFVPALGWVDFDPTNCQVPTGRHITVAWGRDYSDVPPLKGVILTGGKHTLRVSVDVERLADAPDKESPETEYAI